MAVMKIPLDIIGIEAIDQVSWAAGDPGTGYWDVRAQNIKWTPEQAMLPMPTQKMEGMRGKDPYIPGAKAGTLVFELPLRGGNGAKSEAMKFLKNMGEVLLLSDDADEASGGGAATNFPVATPANYSMGMGILVYESGGTTPQIRFSEDEATPKASPLAISPDWASTPAVNDDVWAVDTFTPKTGEPTDFTGGKYMTFRCYYGDGATNYHCFTISGCAGTFKIKGDTNTIPIIEFTFFADTWTPSLTSATQAAESYLAPSPVLGDIMYINNTATAIANLAFDPGIAIEPYTSTAGTNGRAGWLYTMAEPKIEITPWHDNDWYTRLTTPTTFEFMFQSLGGTNPHLNSWALWAKKCQAINVQPDEISGHVSSKPEIEVIDPGKDVNDVNIPMFALAVTGDGT
jgi:hypothetical protein